MSLPGVVLKRRSHIPRYDVLWCFRIDYSRILLLLEPYLIKQRIYREQGLSSTALVFVLNNSSVTHSLFISKPATSSGSKPCVINLLHFFLRMICYIKVGLLELCFRQTCKHAQKKNKINFLVLPCKFSSMALFRQQKHTRGLFTLNSWHGSTEFLRTVKGSSVCSDKNIIPILVYIRFFLH